MAEFSTKSAFGKEEKRIKKFLNRRSGRSENSYQLGIREKSDFIGWNQLKPFFGWNSSMSISFWWVLCWDPWLPAVVIIVLVSKLFFYLVCDILVILLNFHKNFFWFPDPLIKCLTFIKTTSWATSPPNIYLHFNNAPNFI